MIQVNAVPDRAATFVVHPTPGIGDATTIAEALAMLPAGGGEIFIREGTYAISATITLPDKPVAIKGCGQNTIISLGANAIPAFTIPDGLAAFREYVFQDMLITGTSVANQKGWSIEDVNARGIVHVERINTTGIQFPLHLVEGTGTEPVIVTLDDCHFGLLAAGTSILVNTVALAGITANIYMQRVGFYDLFSAVTTGALTAGGFFADFTGVNIIGEDCLFSIGTGGTMGAIVLTNTTIFNFGPGANPIIAVADDNNGVISSNLLGCTGLFVNFEFAGNGTHVVGGFWAACSFTDGAISFFADCFFFTDLTVETAVIIGTGATFVENCWFDNNGTDFVLDGNFNSIIGNRFQANGAGLTSIIRTTNGSATISDNRFENVNAPAILEAGAVSTNNIDNNRWVMNPTLLGDSDAIVNGFKRKNVTGGATVNAFTNQFTHVNDKGLAGSGSIKNTGANSLNYRVEVTDSYGTVSTQTFTVLAGATANWDVSAVFTGALPPYVSFGVSVQSTVPGSPTTFDLRHASVGAY